VKLSHLVGKLMGYVGARFFGAGLGLLTQVLLARLLPQSDVGTVLLGMSAAAFVSLATNGGYTMLAFTQLPRLAVQQRPKLTNAFHKLVLTDTVLLSLVLFGVLYLASLALEFSEAQTVAWFFGCICSPISSLMRYNSIIASTDRRIELSYIPDFVVRPFLFLLGLLLLRASGFPATSFSVLIVFVSVTYVTTIGQALILGRQGLNLLKFGWPRPALTSRLRSRAAALTIVSAASLAFADIVTIVATFVLPVSEAAIVGICIRLAAIAGFILQAGQSFILPDYTAAVMKREKDVARGILLKFNVMTIVVIGAALAGALILGQFALQVFGLEYVKGWWLLVLFMCGLSIRALGGMNQHILSMQGQQLRTAGACLAALLVLTVAAFVFCKSLGFVGMGYAAVCAELTWMVSLAVLAQKWAGRRGDLLWLLRQPK
jgi:O-antigen/teichoic acid export membrane protein